MATKPYVASANYMKRMSNYCQGCAYSPDQRVGENACPFNSLYWSFIDRHYDMLRANPRMQMICASWSKMPEQDKNAILKRAEEVLRHSL
jgi:deoxyribodipyrimidine photolyase-related protein